MTQTENNLVTPINGQIVPLSEVDDPIFAEEMMGQGIAIKPSDTTVYAPSDGVISMVAPSKHAVGITTADGIEMLIHVGLDTVKMEGQGFKLLVAENDTVAKNQPVLEFDKKLIEDSGYTSIVPFIITNSSEFNEIIPQYYEQATHNDTVLSIINK